VVLINIIVFRQLLFRLTHREPPSFLIYRLACLTFRKIACRQLRFLSLFDGMECNRQDIAQGLALALKQKSPMKWVNQRC
jgi:hypothetical protein